MKKNIPLARPPFITDFYCVLDFFFNGSDSAYGFFQHFPSPK